MSLTWTNERVRLRDLKPWGNNPRQITKRAAQRLLDSWRDYGQVHLVVVGPDNEVYDGHQRLSALKAVYGDNYEVEVRRASRALTEEERQRLTVLLHASATGQWNWDALAGWDDSQLIAWGLDEEMLKSWKADITALRALLNASVADALPADAIGGASNPLMLKADTVFQSSNHLGIPDLDPDLIADIDDGITTWFGPGTPASDCYLLVYRNSTERGVDYTRSVLCFYTYDDVINEVYDNAAEVIEKILAKRFMAYITPNFSLRPRDPVVVHMWQVYRSRWVGRYLQSLGQLVVPDIDWVDENSFEFNLLGIPDRPRCVAIQMQSLIADKQDLQRRESALRLIAERLYPQKVVCYGGDAYWRERASAYFGRVVFCETVALARKAWLAKTKRR
jgi:hypothetical protein